MSDFACRVCGFLYDEKPWGESGFLRLTIFASAVERNFGYTDVTVDDVIGYRKYWMGRGSTWFRAKIHRPENWNFEEQLKNVPLEFR